MASLERQHFWGCTLTKDKPEVEWLANDDDLDSEVDILNQLALSQACLGQKAKESASHVVEVTTKGINSNKITQPILILGGGVKQVQCRLEFSSSATFKLAEGHGPVHLAGSHIQVLSGDYSSEEESEEDEGIESAKQSPTKNKASPSPIKQPPAKRAKMDTTKVIENQDSGDEDEPKLVPIKEKNKTQIKKTPQKNQQQAKKDKSDLLEEEAEEESESEDDDEGDEDFMADESDDDDDSEDEDEDDDGDDDDEEEMDDEDDDSEDDSDEDESDEASEKDITNAIIAKQKKKGVQQNGTTTKKGSEKKTPQKGDEKKTPQKGSEKKTPNKATPNTSKLSPPDMDTIKQKLLKSPNLPKKIEKFRNFMKTNQRITEDKTIRDLWTWLQKNKK